MHFKWYSVIGFLIGVCIAFFVVIGDLGPPLAVEFLNIEVNFYYAWFEYVFCCNIKCKCIFTYFVKICCDNNLHSMINLNSL